MARWLSAFAFVWEVLGTVSLMGLGIAIASVATDTKTSVAVRTVAGLSGILLSTGGLATLLWLVVR